jgi:hypothetical protein
MVELPDTGSVHTAASAFTQLKEHKTPETHMGFKLSINPVHLWDPLGGAQSIIRPLTSENNTEKYGHHVSSIFEPTIP